ncbi:redoxin domain-containing protein [bacterium SCSIO 12643]|nr:redoxin domain-containing protein [bacterium SCSIO 12643]
MKKAFYSSFIVFVALTAMSFITIHGPLQIGESGAAAFRELTTNMDGADAPLRAYVQKNGMVVLFSSNDCNYSNNWEDRYDGLAKYCHANGLGFVVVNSNSAERNGKDSFQAMKEHAKAHAYTFPYLVDHNAAIAHTLGAKTTPQVFLFDSNFRLVYRGLIDDNHKDASKVNTTYALNAMRNYISGITPDPAITTEVGCKIKDVK